jgi:hypothetical protein
MTSGRRVRFTVMALLIGGAVGCSSGSKTGADKFVGTWTYSGAIDGNCNGLTVNPIDLTGQSVTITEIDSSHINVALGTMCTVKFDVDNFTATAQSGQKCMFNLGGTFGQQSVTITKWTLTSTGTDTATSDFSGTVLVCAPTGSGTLTRVGDAGAGQ